MVSTQDQFDTVSRYAEESERRAERMAEVVAHLKKHGQSAESAEKQMSQFHAMARGYRDRRDQLQAQILAKRRES